MLFSALPAKQGLYDPEAEVDSCGVAMVTDIHGRRSHSIVADGLLALENLEHRGAAGAETNSGDGAGILIQLPDELLRDTVDFDLPEPAADGSNSYAAGTCFLPMDPDLRRAAIERVEALAADEGITVDAVRGRAILDRVRAFAVRTKENVSRETLLRFYQDSFTEPALRLRRAAVEGAI